MACRFPKGLKWWVIGDCIKKKKTTGGRGEAGMTRKSVDVLPKAKRFEHVRGVWNRKAMQMPTCAQKGISRGVTSARIGYRSFSERKRN